MIGFAESPVSTFAEKAELVKKCSLEKVLFTRMLDMTAVNSCIVHRHVLARSVNLKQLRQLVTVTSLCQGDIRVPRALTTSTVPDIRCDRSSISSTLGINNIAVRDMVAKA